MLVALVFNGGTSPVVTNAYTSISVTEHIHQSPSPQVYLKLSCFVVLEGVRDSGHKVLKDPSGLVWKAEGDLDLCVCVCL